MKCDKLETEMWLDYGGEPMPCYPAKDVDAAIAELNVENSRLKRALWLARAAMCRTYDSCAYFIEKPDSKRRFIEFFVLMQKAAATAAIKAEEYK